MDDEGKRPRPRWWSRPQDAPPPRATSPQDPQDPTPVSPGQPNDPARTQPPPPAGERPADGHDAAPGAPDGHPAAGHHPGAVPESAQDPAQDPVPHGTAPDVPPALPVPDNPYAASGGALPPPEPPESTGRCPADPYRPPPYGEPGPWAPVPAAGGRPAYDPWAAPVRYPPGGPRRARRGRMVAGALGIALLAGGIGGLTGALLAGGNTRTDVSLPQAPAGSTGRAPGTVAGIAQATLPGVVYIHVKAGGQEATGTGIILDTAGHILTNNHVVQPAASDGTIQVTFNNGGTQGAAIVGRDAGYDLAVVKVSGVTGLHPLALGNSASVRVGDPVIAIGAPYDLEGTVTSGIVSAKDRAITAAGDGGGGSDVSYVDAIQTDAPINPGNSGGPLMNSKGQVIGINSAIRSADSDSGGQGGSIGLGFAIPVNQARTVAEQLINTGHAVHPVIGVTVDMRFGGRGARIADRGANGSPAVTPGGPGARAGLRPGDVITKVDGVPVASGEELIVRTRSHQPGDHVRLTVRRGGATLDADLVLGGSTGG